VLAGFETSSDKVFLNEYVQIATTKNAAQASCGMSVNPVTTIGR
jgi:hypothetical protein